MKNYSHLIAVAGILIPLFAGAEIPSYSVPFRMSPIACPLSSPFSQRGWSFTQLEKPMTTGECKAHLQGADAYIKVNSWQSEPYLNQVDSLNNNYTVGAGIAACQKAVCTLQVSGGVNNNSGEITAMRAGETWLAPTRMTPPPLNPKQIALTRRVQQITGRATARSAPAALKRPTAPAARAGVMMPPPMAGWVKPKPTLKVCDAISREECRKDASEVQGNSMGMPKNTCQWLDHLPVGKQCATIQLP